MAVVETQVKRPTQAESAFINFCSSIATGQGSQPYWLSNIKQFEKVFVKFKIHDKSHVPIVTFVDKHRETLEAPLMNGDTPNDGWLAIPDGLAVPTPKSLMPVEPRGVYLPMRDCENGYLQCLPLAEVYAGCLAIGQSERTQFAGVTVESLPAKFLLLFYQMLVEAEPENKAFQDNVETADTMVIEVGGSGGMMEALGGMLTPENMEKMNQMAAPMMGLFNPEIAEKLKNASDLPSAISTLQPYFGGLADMIPGMMSSVMGAMSQGTTTTTTSSSPLQIEAEAGASDQE